MGSDESLRAASLAFGAEAQKKTDAARQEGLQKLQTCVNKDGAVGSVEAAGPSCPFLAV